MYSFKVTQGVMFALKAEAEVLKETRTTSK